MPKRLEALVMMTAALLCGNALAGDISDADRSTIDSTIASQIAAFGRDDGAEAYGYASPGVRRIFPSVEIFMNMVRNGYPQVYRPQRYSFSSFGIDQSGRPAQHVIIVGPGGKTYEAIYFMQRQLDGSWKIDGCTIAELRGAGA